MSRDNGNFRMPIGLCFYLPLRKFSRHWTRNPKDRRTRVNFMRMISKYPRTGRFPWVTTLFAVMLWMVGVVHGATSLQTEVTFGLDGASPYWLIYGQDGFYYGTASQGGFGLIYKIKPDGSL